MFYGLDVISLEELLEHRIAGTLVRGLDCVLGIMMMQHLSEFARRSTPSDTTVPSEFRTFDATITSLDRMRLVHNGVSTRMSQMLLAVLIVYSSVAFESAAEEPV